MKFSSRVFVCIFLLGLPTIELLAGPGGKIAKSLSDTPAGKFILIGIVVLVLPLIIYNIYKDRRNKSKAMAVLKKLSLNDKRFDWLNLKSRITDVFTRVHSAWEQKDMENASEFMTSWYWQNQQSVYLNKWEEQGLVNVTNLREIKSIDPIYIQSSNLNEYDDSKVVVAISANMEDYLKRKSDNKVMEGIMGFKDRTTVWTFVLNEGAWKVMNIEPDSTIIEYRKMSNEVSLSQA